MSGIEYIVGAPEVLNLPLPVYSREALDFLTELSKELMAIPEARTYPDLASAAFWCRRSNLERLKASCPGTEDRLGRGLAFHIAPSNIPINFAFSWFFALLAGNASIVRLPSRRHPQADAFCGAVRRVLPRHPEIQKRTAFVRYPAGSETTAAFSLQADVRLIWGGDATIAVLRACPVKPKCVDAVFADRYSICVLDGGAILACEAGRLRRLAEGFYNDTYLMDQNACSSPQLILWLQGSEAARTRFWNAVEEYAAARYDLQGMLAVDKYTRLCQDAVERPEVAYAVRQGGNLLYRAELSQLPIGDRTGLRGKGGYFYEYDLAALDELCPLVDEKYQTVTVFGVPAEDVRQMVIQNRLRGIDRVVPVGSAMDIGIVWDGYDLVSVLSRIVQAL